MKISSSTFLFFLICLMPAHGQQKQMTSADYARAEKFLYSHTSKLVFHGAVRAQWIDRTHFWYSNRIQEGTEFILVDATRGRKRRAFDHNRLAQALSETTGDTLTGTTLNFRYLEFSDDLAEITFSYKSKKYIWNRKKKRLMEGGEVQRPDFRSNTSPDGSKAVFIRDYNLWVRNLATGAEKQLTKDGIQDFGYATDNAGWTRSDRPVVLWSPDSKKIATFQQDERGVGEWYMVSVTGGHPKLDAWKYPLPEDSVIFRIHRVIIDTETGRMVRLNMPPDQHRSTTTDHIAERGRFLDVAWSHDGKSLAFVSVSRDHKDVVLRVADAATGEVRDVLSEHTETFFESGYNDANWRYLPESNEVIWYSQRDDWGHLYLYDLNTGKLKNRITGGPWKVLQIKHLDKIRRVIYFTGAGKEPGDPYFQYLYRVDFDGNNLQLLTPDSANHTVTFSEDANWFVDVYSTPATPPVSVLRDNTGDLVTTLEECDISGLEAAGWKPPVPVTVKARDGKTDLYGLMFVPTNLDPSKKYPIINAIYPGPQTGSVRGRSFQPSRGDKQALAELGFIVVSIDAMGTPMRSHSFHAAYYGNMGDNGLPDQIAGMKQLAEKYPWIDINRVGIYGHSGGGYAAADAILRYPGFFKVAVSESGNHDNRLYEDDWGEKWQGLLVENPDGTTSYDNQANQNLAENLKGHLLLAHGTLDGNVPTNNTLILVQELIKANKDFDLILFPNRGHGYGADSPYMMRRKWDYFVRYLLGAEPPKEYKFNLD